MTKMELVCCNKPAKKIGLWILRDIKGFSARKLLVGRCTVCNDEVVTLIETRVSDKKVFINSNIRGIEAVKTLYREKKRVICKYSDIDLVVFSNWVYGINKEVKNKKGETEIRQYSCVLETGKKKLLKTIKC